MIRIYPSNLPGLPLEEHDVKVTLGEWLSSKYPNTYRPGEEQPFLAFQNDKIIPFCDWDKATGDIDLKFISQGPVFAYIPYVIYALAAVAVGYMMTAMIPKIPGINSHAAGNNINSANSKANSPRLNDIIPECVGTYIRYPDYLVPPHSYYVGKTEQVLEMFLCVGKGSYEIDKIKIGDTLISTIPEIVTCEIFEPGVDVNGSTEAEWWHTAKEVGGTTSGNAGLELNTLIEQTPNAVAGEYTFSAFTITPTSVLFPQTWRIGLNVRVVCPITWTVIDGGVVDYVEQPDIIEGDMTELMPFPGMIIEIAGVNAGFYKINTVASNQITILSRIDVGWGEEPTWEFATDLTLGSCLMTIGYSGLLYQITNFLETAIIVERITDTRTVDSSWTGFTTLVTSTATMVVNQTETVGRWVGPFMATPLNETTSLIEWDVFFPGGLVYIGDDGNLYESTVSVETQYRVPEGIWVSITKEYSEASVDQIGFTESVVIDPPSTIEVRQRRIGAASTDVKKSDKVLWNALRSKIIAPSSYEGVTTMSVKIFGTKTISSQSEQMINCEVSRILPVYSGGVWTDTITRSIAPVVAYIAHSIGYTDSELDLAELTRLGAIWDAREDYFDFMFNSGTVRDNVNLALAAGFSQMTINRGLIKPIRDELKTEFEHMYTPQNMTKTLKRSFSAVRPEENDGVEIEFVNKLTWVSETVVCKLPTDAGFKLEKVRLDGIVDKIHAWRIGMRRRRHLAYRRWKMEFSTELDALNSQFMSYVALGDDVPGYGQSSLLISCEVSGDLVSLIVNEPTTWIANVVHYVGIRTEEGLMDGPYVAYPGSSAFEILADLPILPDIVETQEPPHVLFGPSDRWTFPSLVTEIKPNGSNDVSVTAMNYDARVYADDDNSPT